jgi:hypothetical protein
VVKFLVAVVEIVSTTFFPEGYDTPLCLSFSAYRKESLQMNGFVQAKERPLGVTILAILAGIAAVLAAFHTLQFLGIIPFFIGPVAIRSFNFWYALMWGLMVWVYVWLVRMLWRVEREAWLFLVIITTFNLILDFVVMIGAARWEDVAVSFLFNAAVLIYCMLPGVRSAFGTYV